MILTMRQISNQKMDQKMGVCMHPPYQLHQMFYTFWDMMTMLSELFWLT